MCKWSFKSNSSPKNDCAVGWAKISNEILKLFNVILQPLLLFCLTFVLRRESYPLRWKILWFFPFTRDMSSKIVKAFWRRATSFSQPTQYYFCCVWLIRPWYCGAFREICVHVLNHFKANIFNEKKVESNKYLTSIVSIVILILLFILILSFERY